jgi:membrane associated rhomboid family serine protease
LTDHLKLDRDQKNPAKSENRMINLPPVVLAVIGVLVVVHVILQFGGSNLQTWSQYALAFIPARFGPVPFPQIPGSAYWSMLTYGLLHADWMHLGFNSLWLGIFSKPVATRLGALRYMVLLAVSVIAGAVAGLIVHWGELVIMVGVSAGVSGIIAAAIPIMYASGGGGLGIGSDRHIRDLKPLSPFQILQNRNAMGFTILWLGLTMLTATSQYLTGTAFLEERVIAWEAHLGGFIAGFIAFYLLDRK